MTRTLSILIGMSLLLTGLSVAHAQQSREFSPTMGVLRGQAIEEGLARAQREGIAAREHAEDRARALAREDREDQTRAADSARLKAREEAREYERRIAPNREESRVDWSQAKREPTVTNPYSPYLGLPTDVAEGELQRQILQLNQKIEALERQRR